MAAGISRSMETCNSSAPQRELSEAAWRLRKQPGLEGVRSSDLTAFATPPHSTQLQREPICGVWNAECANELVALTVLHDDMPISPSERTPDTVAFTIGQ
jgi:hypothetical protein